MENNLKYVAHTLIGSRISTISHLCICFNINLRAQLIGTEFWGMDSRNCLKENFIFFLIENKTFIKIFELDYYLDKRVEIIANKIGRPVIEIENYLNARNIIPDFSHPFRYLSSYKIDKDLGGDYNFLNYLDDHYYEGNFEFRRRLL